MVNHNLLFDSDGYYSYRVYKQKEIQILLLIFKNNVFLIKNYSRWLTILDSNHFVLPTLNDAPC
jgi:hypothetical protein